MYLFPIESNLASIWLGILYYNVFYFLIIRAMMTSKTISGRFNHCDPATVMTSRIKIEVLRYQWFLYSTQPHSLLVQPPISLRSHRVIILI